MNAYRRYMTGMDIVFMMAMFIVICLVCNIVRLARAIKSS